MRTQLQDSLSSCELYPLLSDARHSRIEGSLFLFRASGGIRIQGTIRGSLFTTKTSPCIRKRAPIYLQKSPAWLILSLSSLSHHSHTGHCNTLQHTATHCNTLQHTSAHCNTLQHTATHCNTLQHTATHCNTLQHTATHYNTLQHTTTHCNTLQPIYC